MFLFSVGAVELPASSAGLSKQSLVDLCLVNIMVPETKEQFQTLLYWLNYRHVVAASPNVAELDKFAFLVECVLSRPYLRARC
jgi:hypothetical protein